MSFPIKGGANGKRNETIGYFVELGRVARNGLSVTNKYESPREVGRNAIYLTVREIPEADARPAKGDGRHKSIKNPNKAFLGNELIEECHGNEYATCTAMAAESAFPNFNKAGWVLQIGVDKPVGCVDPAIEKAVAQACTNDSANSHVDKNLVRPIVRQFLVPKFPPNLKKT